MGASFFRREIPITDYYHTRLASQKRLYRWLGKRKHLLACPKERKSSLVFKVLRVFGREITYHVVVAPEVDVVKTEGVIIEDMGNSAPPRWRNRTNNQYLKSLAKKSPILLWKLLTKDIISHPPAVSNSCAINFNLGLAPIAY